ncbi:MAG: hypothetical protein GX195_00355 [Firmicutes bacterium]|jgi:formate hydrogenlyase subunit 3/multisubunit Na+/H+ antiporter MnhD subunit|nr:hypothetical protein [Bacillota bacterium]
MLGAAAVVVLYVLVAVGEVMLWEERTLRRVLIYSIMMAAVCILTALLALGIEPPKGIVRGFVGSLLQKLGMGG